jgi:hypothetical protein
MTKRPLEFLPVSINFSEIESGGENEEDPIEFGVEDQAIENPFPEEDLINVLKSFPKDKYRVIALLLFLNEMGFEFRYEDIAGIWGHSKVAVFNTISRMQKTLVKSGVTRGN